MDKGEEKVVVVVVIVEEADDNEDEGIHSLGGLIFISTFNLQNQRNGV